MTGFSSNNRSLDRGGFFGWVVWWMGIFTWDSVGPASLRVYDVQVIVLLRDRVETGIQRPADGSPEEIEALRL